jgi:PST family polysaccharide transporter
MSRFEYIKRTIIKSKILENYVYMTSLQILSSLIGILIYPYLIRTLGKESYGLYAFAFSITTFFIIFIAFGFNYPAMRRIVECKDDLKAKNEVVSSVFTAKCYLTLLATAIFSALVILIPTLRKNYLVFFLCYGQVLTQLFFPSWYFQAMQKMKIVTCIQLAFRLLTIPFILLLIKTTDQTWLYTLIALISVLLGAMAATYILWSKEKIKLRIVPFRFVKEYYKESLPFFWAHSACTIKEESVTVLIGSFLGMGDVALYDLAKKVITIPHMLVSSINGALFPKVVNNANRTTVKKILRYETAIGLACIAGIIVAGYWVILLLGGENMTGSYPLCIIYSITILSWLLVGGYTNFVFIPTNRYYLVTRTQLTAILSFTVFVCASSFFCKNTAFIIGALSLSSLVEVVYCWYVSKKYHLL